MAKVIIPKSDQLNADSLISGPITIKVTGVTFASTEQPISVHYEGDNGKPWKPCKSTARVLVHIWGSDSKKYVGRSLTLYRDDKVKWGGLAVGGIRISHMSDMTAPVTMALTESKGSRKPVTIHPLTVAQEDPALAPLLAAGRDAAAKGVDGFTAWASTLTPAQKDMVPKDTLADWRVEAKKVTDAAKATPDPEAFPGDPK